MVVRATGLPERPQNCSVQLSLDSIYTPPSECITTLVRVPIRQGKSLNLLSTGTSKTIYTGHMTSSLQQYSDMSTVSLENSLRSVYHLPQHSIFTTCIRANGRTPNPIRLPNGPIVSPKWPSRPGRLVSCILLVHDVESGDTRCMTLARGILISWTCPSTQSCSLHSACPRSRYRQSFLEKIHELEGYKYQPARCRVATRSEWWYFVL